MVTEEDRDYINDIFVKSTDNIDTDEVSDIIQTPVLVIDIDEVNGEAKRQAEVITERLSGYYFDPKYLDEHPYVPTKIAQEMDSIRRLIKMLTVNEKAQDALICNITSNAGKGSLYQSLTSLQGAMLSIQKQLNDRTNQLEIIFKEMQAECEKTFTEKPKETELDDGSIMVRGSREFIKTLNNKLFGVGHVEIETTDDGTTYDPITGEVISEPIVENK